DRPAEVWGAGVRASPGVVCGAANTDESEPGICARGAWGFNGAVVGNYRHPASGRDSPGSDSGGAASDDERGECCAERVVSRLSGMDEDEREREERTRCAQQSCD